MHSLRWHPLLQQWVAVTTARQNRPQMPANWCPFDPGSGRVPDNYDVYLYPNDFPAFSPDQPPFSPNPGLYAETFPQGACDVVLYSSEHTIPPSKLPLERWREVIDLWTTRSREHASNPAIAQISVFENCGEAVGVTMPHPHGQIYALPFLSPTTERELDGLRKHAEENGGECLFCRLLTEETDVAERIVAANSDFLAFVPFAARFPAEIWLVPRRHSRTLMELSDSERGNFAEMMSTIRRKYDNLYGFLLPLMMAVKQAPTKLPGVPYHLHVQFLPLQRSATKLKYLATIETAYGTFLADTAPEDTAAILRFLEPRTAADGTLA